VPNWNQSLYRLYNNGEGNAPNHRLTGSDTLRSEQVSRGWIGEGSGSPPVFACVRMTVPGMRDAVQSVAPRNRSDVRFS